MSATGRSLGGVCNGQQCLPTTDILGGDQSSERCSVPHRGFRVKVGGSALSYSVFGVHGISGIRDETRSRCFSPDALATLEGVAERHDGIIGQDKNSVEEISSSVAVEEFSGYLRDALEQWETDPMMVTTEPSRLCTGFGERQGSNLGRRDGTVWKQLCQKKRRLPTKPQSPK